MYVLNPATLTLRDFEPDGGMPFSKGHIFVSSRIVKIICG